MIADGQERLELILVEKVARERHDDTVGGDPERAAVGPLRAGRIDRRGEALEMIRKHEIVVRDKRDVFPAGLSQGDIPIGVAEAKGLWEIEPADAPIIEARDNGCRVVGAGITDDQQLEIALGLIDYARNRQP